MPLSESEEARKALALELYDRFHAMKTYGKEPESLESIVRIFSRDLASFSLEKVQRAISLHAQRSQEFPTVCDIMGLIKRGGKPPLSKEIYIGISKKDAETRTSQDWQYLRDYEAQANEDFGSDFIDEKKESNFADERIRLRKELIDAKSEIKKLSLLLVKKRERATVSPAKLPAKDKEKNTIEFLKNSGATQEAIDDFLASQNPDYTYRDDLIERQNNGISLGQSISNLMGQRA